MNVILPRLLKELRQDDWTVTEHSAATTAAGRITCGIEKSHHGDAALTGCPTRLDCLPDRPIIIKAVGRGTRQRIMADRYGTPRGAGHQRYCRLPKHIKRITPTPSHKKRTKRVDDVATGDYVQFIHQGNIVHGYGSISHEQIALTKPSWKSIRTTSAKVLERGHGYQLSYP